MSFPEHSNEDELIATRSGKTINKPFKLFSISHTFLNTGRLSNIYRSSHPEVFCKKDVLKNFTILTEKHESLFNKAAGLQACSCIKKETPAPMFSCEYCEIFKNTYFEEDL